jgi:cytochrome c-type biogenesis protein CcmH
MFKSSVFIALLFCLSTTLVLASPVETFQFKDEVTKVRFQSLTKELRCPKCQNQDLADSNSPIAADLRKKVYEMLQLGKSDDEILRYMVDRYGDFVLYRPRVNSLTYILWFAPIGFFVIGFLVVWAILRKRPKTEAKVSISAEQQDKLSKILKNK